MPRNHAGLAVRQATWQDIPSLVEFNSMIHGQVDSPSGFDAWTVDLCSGRHPTTSVDDFTVCIDRASGTLVGAACLIPQTWKFGDATISVGRVELVGTHPQFRGRGVVGRVLRNLERRALKRGVCLLGITGLDQFYRKFGYEYGLRFGTPRILTTPSGTESRTLSIRPPKLEDLIQIESLLAERAEEVQSISCVRPKPVSSWELFDQSVDSPVAFEYRVAEDSSGQVVGIVGFLPKVIGSELWVGAVASRPGTDFVDLLQNVDAVLRSTLTDRGGSQVVYRLWADAGHEIAPYSEAVGSPEAWYFKAINIAALLESLKSVWSESAAPSRSLTPVVLDFYDDRFSIDLHSGGIARVDASTKPHLAISRDAFVRLLFGFLSWEEILRASPECRVFDPVRTADLVNRLGAFQVRLEPIG